MIYDSQVKHQERVRKGWPKDETAATLSLACAHPVCKALSPIKAPFSNSSVLLLPKKFSNSWLGKRKIDQSYSQLHLSLMLFEWIGDYIMSHCEHSMNSQVIISIDCASEIFSSFWRVRITVRKSVMNTVHFKSSCFKLSHSWQPWNPPALFFPLARSISFLVMRDPMNFLLPPAMSNQSCPIHCLFNL